MNGCLVWKKAYSGTQKCIFLGGIVEFYGRGLEAPIWSPTSLFYSLSIDTPSE